MRKYLLPAALFWSLCLGCGSSSSAPVEHVYSLDVDFARTDAPGLSPIEVLVSIRRDGVAVSGASAEVTVQFDSGSTSGVIELSGGEYSATLTPSLTGEYPVTIGYADQLVTRTPIVLGTVHPDWGQPMSVEGMVNTAGYEDGPTITADGSYLFVQYGPIYFSSLIAFDLPRAIGGCEGHRLEYPLGTLNRCTHEWFDASIGPYSAPERPGFFDGRIIAGINLHNAVSWGIGIEETIIYAPSTMFYGFARQEDGSYADPFYMAFYDENDGIINPYGLSFRLNGDGTATTLMTMNDPSDGPTIDLDGDGNVDVESGFDLYSSEIILGFDTRLGSYLYSGNPGTPPVMGTDFITQKIEFGNVGIHGNAGTQGNSHIYEEGGTIASIWTDDEYDTGGDHGNLSVHLLDSGVFPAGTWTKLELPSAINEAAPETETQPFFTGTELFYAASNETAPPSVVFNDYTGSHDQASFADNANWGDRETVLAGVTGEGLSEIIAVGEPTLAMIDGVQHLFFVYVVVRSHDEAMPIADVDMQVGYIRKR
ncbi:MAG: hypothetical protein ACI8X5_003704 [Planctomycetota bacterium]|jgi:hypothetical protein